MAMLAEPRRKQKVINLRAKTNAWSNDSTKFGQRMLEKMGWSSGKGLGANENGIVEHVVAKYKNDDKGLGFEDRNDQWTKHEDDFNSLLANLSNGKQDEKLHSGISLEAKSKKSKARVHYHKFTRGKDLTRYSEKDLANIFGKKSLKKEEKEPLSDLTEIVKADDMKASEVVFTEKGSMEDYFKSKISALKSKNKNAHNIEPDYSFKGFAGLGSENPDSPVQCEVSFQGFSFYDENKEETETPDVPTVTSEKSSKKSKKNKKSRQEYEEAQNSCQNKTPDDDFTQKVDSNQTELIKNKKCKRNKHNIEETPEDPPKKKKSKKSKNVEDNEINKEQVEEVIHIPKKKKKKKNKYVEV